MYKLGWGFKNSVLGVWFCEVLGTFNLGFVVLTGELQIGFATSLEFNTFSFMEVKFSSLNMF